MELRDISEAEARAIIARQNKADELLAYLEDSFVYEVETAEHQFLGWAKLWV